MTEKSLLSMREIAEALNVNYKTLHGYKEIFQEYLQTESLGRRTKYLPVNILILSKILELKDQGRSNEDVFSILKQWRQECPRLFLDIGNSGDLDISASGNLKLSEAENLELPDSENLEEQEFGNLEIQESEVPEVSDSESSRLPDSVKSSCPAQEVFSVEEVQVAVLTHLHPTLSNLQAQRTDLTSSLPGDLVPQINAALTQFYKFAMELSARLERLEKELGLELQPMETELDLQSMQIDQDEPTESYVHADLEFVRASIFEGKPDKESVRQWLQRERQDNPGLSYATLAETLNLAGIPTLSGRDTWNRGTLRNLLTER